MKALILPAAVLALAALAAPVHAQVLGTFRWQTQPFCNVVTLTIIQQGPVYQLAGTDDLCGAGPAPVTGTAAAGGSGIVLGFTVTPSAGQPAHVSATFNLTDFSGSWSDNLNRGGTFAFGASAAGTARPSTGPAVTGGNGEGVGNTVCTGPNGVEVFTKDRYGNAVDARFSFIIAGFANGQIRATASIRIGTANLVSVEHPRAGAYCLVFNGPLTQIQRESAVVSINGEQ